MEQASTGALARDPLKDPRGRDVVKKKKAVRTVVRRSGYCIDYIKPGSGVLYSCWITTWCAWCRGAEVLHVAD